jgi:GntR family phosphonate transport system transcriptional regulator
VHARRGAGVFVQHRQMPYPIGKRVRFHQNLWPRAAFRKSAY